MGTAGVLYIPEQNITAPDGGLQTMGLCLLNRSGPIDTNDLRTRIRLLFAHVHVLKLTSHADLAVGVRIGQGNLDGVTSVGLDLESSGRLPLDPAGRLQLVASTNSEITGNASFITVPPTGQLKIFFGIARNRRPLTVQFSRRLAPVMPYSGFHQAVLTIWLYPRFSPAATPLVATIGGFVRFEEFQY